jgi:hypothetical protein
MYIIIAQIGCVMCASVCLWMAAAGWAGISGAPAPLLYDVSPAWGGQGYPLFTSPSQATMALILGLTGATLSLWSAFSLSGRGRGSSSRGIDSPEL